METNDLIIFLKVAELGSFSKAAEQLGYVQPNVTARIKILEDELQAPLFKRTNRGVSLLPEGKVLFEYASQVINLISEAKEKINSHSLAFKNWGYTNNYDKLPLSLSIKRQRSIFVIHSSCA